MTADHNVLAGWCGTVRRYVCLVRFRSVTPYDRDRVAACLRLAVINAGTMKNDYGLSDTRASYDADARGYAEEIRGLLAKQPYLRGSLSVFADLVPRRSTSNKTADTA